MNRLIVKLKGKQGYKELKISVSSSKNELFCCPLKIYKEYQLVNNFSF